MATAAAVSAAVGYFSYEPAKTTNLSRAVKEELMHRNTEEEQGTEEELFCGNTEVVLTTTPARSRMVRFARILASDVKLKLGSMPRPTEANRLVAHELIVKSMIARDVRKVLRLEFAQLAVPLVFLPDSTDIAVSRLVTSRDVSDLLYEVEKGDAVSLWEWLTTRRRKHLRWVKT